MSRGLFYLSDHQFKGLAFSRALLEAGYERAETASAPGLRLGLFDHDLLGLRHALEYLRSQGTPVFLYPHGARPMLLWDMADMEPWPHTSACFVIGEGQAEVLRVIGYPAPVEVCGWPYGEQRPFELRTPGETIRVLYGPIHPNHDGYLCREDREANRRTFDLLMETPGIELTVRHLRRLDLSGVPEMGGVRYVMGRADGSTAEIDAADVVVGHQTFAWLAAARGKPVIMFGDDIPAHMGNRRMNLRWARRYGEYRDILRYPLEAEQASSGAEMRALLERAMGEDAGADWRRRLIGKPYNAKRFVRTVEKYLRGES